MKKIAICPALSSNPHHQGTESSRVREKTWPPDGLAAKPSLLLQNLDAAPAGWELVTHAAFHHTTHHPVSDLLACVWNWKWGTNPCYHLNSLCELTPSLHLEHILTKGSCNENRATCFRSHHRKQNYWWFKQVHLITASFHQEIGTLQPNFQENQFLSHNPTGKKVSRVFHSRTMEPSVRRSQSLYLSRGA